MKSGYDSNAGMAEIGRSGFEAFEAPGPLGRRFKSIGAGRARVPVRVRSGPEVRQTPVAAAERSARGLTPGAEIESPEKSAGEADVAGARHRDGVAILVVVLAGGISVAARRDIRAARVVLRHENVVHLRGDPSPAEVDQAGEVPRHRHDAVAVHGHPVAVVGPGVAPEAL